MSLITTAGLVISKSVQANEELIVTVDESRYRVIKPREQRVTILPQGSTVCVFVVRQMLHTVTWGPWFETDQNPWANFAAVLRQQPGNLCLVSPGNVADFQTWRKELCGTGLPLRPYSGISNFHGNVSCSHCKQAFLTLPEAEEQYRSSRSDEDAPPTLSGWLLLQRAFQRLAEAMPSDLGTEESQAFCSRWMMATLPALQDRFEAMLAPFRTKFLEEVPFLCPNRCCLEKEAHPYNHGESYILVMPTAEAEEDEPTDEDVEDDFDPLQIATRIHAVTALLQLDDFAVPEVLIVLHSCNAAFEPSLAHALQRLGTQFVLGYIKPVWSFTSGFFVASLYVEWEKFDYEAKALQEVFLKLLLSGNDGMRTFIRDTMPVLFLQDGSMLCFDLPAFQARAKIQAIQYRRGQRPFWVFDPRL